MRSGSAPHSTIARTVVRAWRRWPLALAGLALITLGPAICWSLFAWRVVWRLGVLPRNMHAWLLVAGALTVAVGFACIGAQLRPLKSVVAGALLGAAFHLLVGWVFYFGLAVSGGWSPLDILAQSTDVNLLRAYTLWPIVAAAVLRLIDIG